MAGLRARLEFLGSTAGSGRRLTVLSELVMSAEEKCDEALSLKKAGHYGAAIYLAGYAAEMLLKYAYMRLTGALPSESVETRLAPARYRAKHLMTVSVADESYHSLVFWLQLLLEERRSMSRQLGAGVEQAFIKRVSHLYSDWWVEMRYRPDQATPMEAQQALEQASWLKRFHNVLWR